jgi:hypothetical protein
MGCVGCTSAEPDPAGNPVADVPELGRPTTAGGHDTVEVRARLEVEPSTATRALVRFVREHAVSVNRGHVTPGLRAVAAPAELRRQRQVVRDARAQGYAVPTRPQLAIVSVAGRSARAVHLEVCLWLPSVEYVDAASGRPAAGQVPRQWAPVRATVGMYQMTRMVDKLVPARPDDDDFCGGLR